MKTADRRPVFVLKQRIKASFFIIKKVQINANTTALIYIPFSIGSTIRESGKDLSGEKDIQELGEENGRKIVKVGSGTYQFTLGI
ncbi:MAG: hypothetical protein JZU47_21365 [Prolixibacteraceae bacterium]|nr:hypothetical protein [Prolixibacteraceae bacterium]